MIIKFVYNLYEYDTYQDKYCLSDTKLNSNMVSLSLKLDSELNLIIKSYILTISLSISDKMIS